jgi:hypothetical protein
MNDACSSRQIQQLDHARKHRVQLSAQLVGRNLACPRPSLVARWQRQASVDDNDVDVSAVQRRFPCSSFPASDKSLRPPSSAPPLTSNDAPSHLAGGYARPWGSAVAARSRTGRSPPSHALDGSPLHHAAVPAVRRREEAVTSAPRRSGDRRTLQPDGGKAQIVVCKYVDLVLQAPRRQRRYWHRHQGEAKHRCWRSDHRARPVRAKNRAWTPMHRGLLRDGPWIADTRHRVPAPAPADLRRAHTPGHQESLLTLNHQRPAGPSCSPMMITTAPSRCSVSTRRWAADTSAIG